MGMLNRSAIVVTPRQPFLDWLHAADPTSRHFSLQELGAEPTIYLIPECDTDQDVTAILHDVCEEIFADQLSGWFTVAESWPKDRRFDVFCRWFDYRHHSMLIDLCDEPLICESD